jgi:hypothetical protein
MDEVDQNAKLLDINNKENERTTNTNVNSDGQSNTGWTEDTDEKNN